MAKKITNVTHVETHFSEGGTLKRHINAVHNGKKEYTCDSCETSFHQAANLKTHIISVHNEQKDHKCEAC